MKSISYIKSSVTYAKSFCEALRSIALERKFLASTTGFPEETSINFVKNIEDKNQAQYFALAEDSVVGWCDLLPKPHEGMNHVGVLGMGIIKQYRGQGLGKHLMELTLQHAKQQNGLEKAELEVFKSNVVAVNFYQKMGFYFEGEKIKSRKLDGIYDNILLMGKIL